MKTSSAKAKGRRHQQDVAKRLSEKYNLAYGQDEHFYSRGMGQSGVDIGMSPTAREMCKFDIECKNSERWTIPEWWKQTTENTAAGRKPLLVISKNRHDTLAVIRFDDLLELL